MASSRAVPSNCLIEDELQGVITPTCFLAQAIDAGALEMVFGAVEQVQGGMAFLSATGAGGCHRSSDLQAGCFAIHLGQINVQGANWIARDDKHYQVGCAKNGTE